MMMMKVNQTVNFICTDVCYSLFEQDATQQIVKIQLTFWFAGDNNSCGVHLSNIIRFVFMALACIFFITDEEPSLSSLSRHSLCCSLAS